MLLSYAWKYEDGMCGPESWVLSILSWHTDCEIKARPEGQAY